MKKALALLLVFFLSSSGSARQEIAAPVLDKLKAATVFIIARAGRAGATGSGFLFLKRGNSAFVITCHHVIADADDITIVFDSGGPKERSFKGTVIAADPDRDLACLRIKEGKDFPVPLEIGTKTEVRETENVFVAGFPFGRMLAADEKNPEVSLSKASVSSMRRNKEQELVAVQIGGEVHPGNSGGPVTNSKGQVIGVAQSKVMGTGTAFAVPPEEIQIFLRPRARSCSIGLLSVDATKARERVTAVIADAQGQVTSVALHWISKTALGDTPPKKDASGRYLKISSAMESISLKLEDDTATGEGDFPRPSKDADSFEFVFQLAITTSDGKTIWTEPSPSTVRFEATGESNPPPKTDTPGPAPNDPPAPKGVDIPVGDSLKIVNVLPLRSVISDLVLSGDGASLYALNLSDCEVLQINPENLSVGAKAEIVHDAVGMCLTPDGKTIYVAGRAPNMTNDFQRNPVSTLQVLATAGLKVTSTFEVPFAIQRIVATNDGTVVATGIGQSDCLAVIDSKRKSVLGKVSIYGGATLRLHPDQDRVYTGDTGLSPADFRCASLRVDKNGRFPNFDSKYHGDYPLGGNFELSPDGRFLIGCGGVVLKIGKFGRETDLLFVQKIEPCMAYAMAKGTNTFFGTTGDGFLKVFDFAKLELIKSIKLDRFCPQIALDGKRQRLYAFSAAVQNNPYSHPMSYANGYSTFFAGDLIALSVTGK